MAVICQLKEKVKDAYLLVVNSNLPLEEAATVLEHREAAVAEVLHHLQEVVVVVVKFRFQEVVAVGEVLHCLKVEVEAEEEVVLH